VVNRKPTAYIRSTGCISNLLEGTAYERVLEESGYRLVNDIKRAELIILNTCAFSQFKEEEAVRLIERTKRERKNGARMVVCGCLPEINPERLAAIHDEVTFGPRDPTALLEILNGGLILTPPDSAPISYYEYSPLKKAIFQAKRLVEALPLLKALPLVRRLLSPLFIYSGEVFCLKVETGCQGNCTYCAIRFAKGRTKSKPIEEITSEFKTAMSNGYSRFVLVGDEITSYGSDLSGQLDILDLIDMLLENENLTTLFLESFEPSFMISNFERLLKPLSSGKIPVFCSSVQSGSNRILNLMNRGYCVEDFVSCMEEIRRRFPWIYLRSEVIVGFPGETERKFQDTLRLVSRLNLDFLDAYEYQDRPRTPASRMPQKLEAFEKRSRRRKIMRQHWKNVLFKRH
jgi:tRNA A37 methylthiotransferase MiaB